MKKGIALLLIVSLLNTAFQCESTASSGIEQASTCGTPDWLATIISEAKQNETKGEVIQYQYNGQTVFAINTCIGCADSMMVVYDCAGETKCQFGGIAGLNTCPDFEDKATDKKIIWSN